MKLVSKLTIIFSALAVLSVAPLQNVFAQGGSGSAMSVLVQGYGGDALNQLYDGVGVQFYNLLLKAYTNIAYESDPQIPTIINNNAANKTSQDNVGTAVDAAAQIAIEDAFAGIGDKEQQAYKLQQVLAGDDIINTSDSGSVLSNIFSSGASRLSIKLQNEKAKQNNTMFDVKSLIGITAYDSAEKLNAANGFLAEMNGIAQPPVIRLSSPSFKVPAMNASGSKTIGSSDKPVSSQDLVNLQGVLQQNSVYRKYRTQYRQLIALRSIFIENLLHSYQERVPQKDTGKSAYQLRNETVAQRLSPTYYQAMSKVSPATVARETLFLMAQMSAQLNNIQNQNERLIAMKSIDGLITLGATSQIMEQTSKQAGEAVIYCMAHPKDCSKGGSGSSGSDLMQNATAQ